MELFLRMTVLPLKICLIRLSFNNKLYHYTENGKFLSDKIPIELNQDKNLHYSVGHGTIIRPNVDKNGYFKGILFDLYDYDWIKFHLDNWRTAGINNSAFILQQIGLLKNYYILIPIKFKMY